MGKILLKKTEQFVRKILTEELSPNRLFHNWNHTLQVVEAVKEICAYENISAEETELIRLAAWFHDTGHISCYQGHEMASQEIAKDFLKKQKYPKENMAIVLSLIAATTMPQQPLNHLQEVICDADMYHLSLPNYSKIQDLLRQEWSDLLDQQYRDDDWQILNIAFLINHQYFTAYGKKVLTSKKEKNIEHCRERLYVIQHKEI